MVTKLATRQEMFWATQRVEDKICTFCGKNMPRYKYLFCSDRCRDNNAKKNGRLIRAPKNDNSGK